MLLLFHNIWLLSVSFQVEGLRGWQQQVSPYAAGVELSLREKARARDAWWMGCQDTLCGALYMRASLPSLKDTRLTWKATIASNSCHSTRSLQPPALRYWRLHARSRLTNSLPSVRKLNSPPSTTAQNRLKLLTYAATLIFYCLSF